VLSRSLQEQRLSMYSENALKLGIFGPNCSSGLSATRVPERWSGSWTDNLTLAKLLDETGIEFILPVGRWKGYGGETNFESDTFETLTWATGLLGATKRITIFGTVHAPLIHPVFAAKQCVTADHVGSGRFGLNVVCGWNPGEFRMFGADTRQHDDRYVYAGEWLEIVRRIWEGDEEFDYSGTYFTLEGVCGGPRPFGSTRPLIMNAGASPAGQAFALDAADYLFYPYRSAALAECVTSELRAAAARRGRAVGIFTHANVVCRPTQKEAEEYFKWFADDMANVEAIEHHHRMAQGQDVTTHLSEEDWKKNRVRYGAGYGGYPCIGDPDRVAEELAAISQGGLTGIALGFCNYLREFPYFRQEVLPRLESMGLRTSN
jgi:alkanesulfonate monooxygenase SsuD/methylene tetrahydromethanopterin reductase-like flavin-dependent oxidoreductase (luciferase family)